MINTPETPIKLDEQQVEKLATFERRLANVQAEIALANQSVLILRGDIDKAAKERAYQEELVASLKIESEAKHIELEALKESAIKLTSEVNEKTEQAKVIGVANEKFAQELKEREKDIARREKECGALEDVLNFNTKELADEKLSVLVAKDAFLKAVESVTWK